MYTMSISSFMSFFFYTECGIPTLFLTKEGLFSQKELPKTFNVTVTLRKAIRYMTKRKKAYKTDDTRTKFPISPPILYRLKILELFFPNKSHLYQDAVPFTGDFWHILIMTCKSQLCRNVEGK